MPNLVRRAGAPIVAVLAGVLAAAAVSAGFPQARAEGSASRRLEGPDTHRVLVVPVNLHGRAPLAIDRKQITQALYGAEDSVASRYRVISYGMMEFAGSEGDIVDPVALSEPTDFCDSGLKRLAGEAEDEVRRQGIPLRAYKHVVLVIPEDSPCWWTGVGDIGGTRVWVKATTAKALQHELGHNLGMNHAVHWRSSDADGSDFMGFGGASLNAPHVVEMGWLRGYPGKQRIHSAERGKPPVPGLARRIARQRRQADCMGLPRRYQPDLALRVTHHALKSAATHLC